ncbi:MAG: modification methylase PaeR7I [Acidobacteria bacterium]|nr:modification methylase PaeR7I [Acidobacteriota bacterium]
MEKLPKDLLKAYRARWRSLFDRADLYVAFIEKSLGLLRPDGRLGFICADRWMKNRYGGPLREIVARDFHLESYVDFTGCPAFLDEVDAYPAVTVIRKGHGETTRAAFRPVVSRDHLVPLARALVSHEDSPQVTRLSGVCRGDAPWAIDEFGVTPVIRKLEAEFPTIESAGCKIGIGVATGADAVFLGSAEKLDVEAERRLPLITTKDIRHGRIEWGGLYVLNPFGSDGRLVDPNAYPKFRAYINAHRAEIAKRNVAERNPAGWYRTIDRIHASLASRPKLLIPDIKGHAHVVLEEGHYYPHHNLYFVTADQWDLRALQAVLLSAVTRLFVATYSTKMRGGFLRFQAQYIRRLRLPEWASVPETLRQELAEAARKRDLEACNLATFHLYQLSEQEIAALTQGRE